MTPDDFWRLQWWEFTAYCLGREKAYEHSRYIGKLQLMAAGVKAYDADRSLPTPLLDNRPPVDVEGIRAYAERNKKHLK